MARVASCVNGRPTPVSAFSTAAHWKWRILATFQSDDMVFLRPLKTDCGIDFSSNEGKLGMLNGAITVWGRSNRQRHAVQNKFKPL